MVHAEAIEAHAEAQKVAEAEKVPMPSVQVATAFSKAPLLMESAVACLYSASIVACRCVELKCDAWLLQLSQKLLKRHPNAPL